MGSSVIIKLNIVKCYINNYIYLRYYTKNKINELT